MPDRRVVVAGGGASGLLLAHSLVRSGASVTVVEPRERLGAGVAYSTNCELHILNVPAGKMSAVADDPDHFVRWLTAQGYPDDPEAFVPRSTFGDYLASIADDVRALGAARFRHVRAVALDAFEDAGSIRVACSDETTLDAAAFVVAVGNANPSPWPNVPEDVRTSPHFFDSAWTDGATHAADDEATIVLLGTGLTAVDAVLSLRERGHRGRIVMVSRRGLLPHEHRLFDSPPAVSPEAQTVGDVIAAVREARRRSDTDWRLAIDALRSNTNARWEALSLSEQSRFVRHVLPYWNVHRHRMAPQAAKTIAKLLADGTLQMIAGRTGPLEASASGIRVTVAVRGGGVKTIDAGHVINCSGPEHDITKRNNPLIKRLLERGTMVSHPLKIGALIAGDGALIEASGAPSTRFFAIGPVRYGTLIETTAIPEIRDQATALTGVLLDRSPAA